MEPYSVKTLNYCTAWLMALAFMTSALAGGHHDEALSDRDSLALVALESLLERRRTVRYHGSSRSCKATTALSSRSGRYLFWAK